MASSMVRYHLIHFIPCSNKDTQKDGSEQAAPKGCRHTIQSFMPGAVAIAAIFGTVTDNLRQMFGAVMAVLTVNAVSHPNDVKITGAAALMRPGGLTIAMLSWACPALQTRDEIMAAKWPSES